MAPEVHIRRARPADLELLAPLARRTFHDAFAADNDPADMAQYLDEAFSREQIELELADPGSTFLVAAAAGSAMPAGYAKLRAGTAPESVRGVRPVELHRIYVEQSAVGLGIGSALLSAVFAEVRRQGWETLWLGVWDRNERAIAFYESRGFETVGSHTFLLGEDEQTDLIMARSLPPPETK